MGKEGVALNENRRHTVNRLLIVLGVAALLGGLLLSQRDQVLIHAILL